MNISVIISKINEMEILCIIFTSIRRKTMTITVRYVGLKKFPPNFSGRLVVSIYTWKHSRTVGSRPNNWEDILVPGHKESHQKLVFNCKYK